MKKVWLAGVLSFLFPGLGHLYLGKVLKGVLFIAADIVSLRFTTNLIGILVYFAIWVFAILDSIKTTRIINKSSIAN